MSKYNLKVKISIADENLRGFFGIGIVWLLENIEQTGSIRQAAKNLGMSYSKAHKILTRVEKNFGKKLLHKTRGGIDRGGSDLTPFAKEFIERYKEFQNSIKKFADKEFKDKILNHL
jgi:molybdate transport system regulatory protein